MRRKQAGFISLIQPASLDDNASHCIVPTDDLHCYLQTPVGKSSESRAIDAGAEAARWSDAAKSVAVEGCITLHWFVSSRSPLCCPLKDLELEA